MTRRGSTSWSWAERSDSGSSERSVVAGPPGRRGEHPRRPARGVSITDEILQTTTIVTAAATRFLSQVHHRMPVVLEAENFTRWLDGDMELLDEVISRPPDFQAWPVDRRVNNARNEGPELIAAAGDSLPR